MGFAHLALCASEAGRATGELRSWQRPAPRARADPAGWPAAPRDSWPPPSIGGDRPPVTPVSPPATPSGGQAGGVVAVSSSLHSVRSFQMQGTRNLAHRMGRWSGMHPWTAIIGWIAFVAVAFVVGSASRSTPSARPTPASASPAGRRRSSTGLHRFGAAPRGADLHPEPLGQARRDRHPRRRRRRHQAPSGDRRRAEIKAVERSANGRAARLPFTVAGPHDAGDRQGRADARPRRGRRRRTSVGLSSSASAMRRPASRSMTSSPTTSTRPRCCSIPITLRDPDRRVRRAARRGHPGAARPHVGVLGVRPVGLTSSHPSPRARARRS